MALGSAQSPAPPASRRHVVFIGLSLVVLSFLPISGRNFERAFDLVGLSILATALISSLVIAVMFSSRTRTLGFIHIFGVWLMLCMAALALHVRGDLEHPEFFPVHFDIFTLIVSSLVVVFWTVAFVFAYRQAVRTTVRRSSMKMALSPGGVWLQIFCGLVSLWFIYEKIGLGIGTRAGFEEAFASESSIQVLLTEYPLRMMSVFALAASIIRIRARPRKIEKRCLYLGIAMLAVGILIINNPFAAPRFFTGSVAIGFLYMLWASRGPSNLRLLTVLLVAVFLVFPLDFGRQSADIKEAVETAEYSLGKAFQGDAFRTYEAIPAAIVHNERFGSTNGLQLVGNLLFFVPRSVWPDKSIGSGAMIAERLGAGFTNVACSLPCEGYINGGVLGVLALAVIFGWILAKLDRWYWAGDGNWGTGMSAVVYPFLIGCIFFMTRGDLLSPMAFTVSMLLGVSPLALSQLRWHIYSIVPKPGRSVT